MVLGVLLVGLAACTDDDADDEERRDEATPVEPVVLDELEWTECERRDEGFVVSHPVGWETTDGTGSTCGAFGPSGAPDGPVVELRTLDEPLTTLVDRAEDEGGLVDTTILERRSAAEVDPNVAEEARWLVDLRNGRTLEVVGRVSPVVDPDTLDAVVGRMMEDLRWIDPRSSGEGLEPVGAPVDATVEGRPDEPDDLTKLVTDLRAAGQDGFDRIVIEFDGDREPQYRVEPRDLLPTVAEAGIPVEGDAFLDVTISPVAIIDEQGERSYEGPTRVPAAGGAIVEEAVLIPSLAEDELRVVIGLRRAAGFAVAVIPEPVRLVIDVIHDPVAGEDP